MMFYVTSLLWLLCGTALVLTLGVVLLPAATRHDLAHVFRVNRRTNSISDLEGDWYEVGERCVGCGEFKKWFRWNASTDERVYDEKQ